MYRGAARMHQTRHFRKRATSAAAEGPAYGLDFARRWQFPLRALQAQKCHVYGSGTFGAAWFHRAHLDTSPTSPSQFTPVGRGPSETHLHMFFSWLVESHTEAPRRKHKSRYVLKRESRPGDLRPRGVVSVHNVSPNRLHSCGISSGSGCKSPLP